MASLSYRRHRFPPEIIQHAIWLYLRFTLSYRDVEELLAEHGLDLSYETVRRWVRKVGPLIARRLRRGRPRPSDRWQLDETVVRIAGKYVLSVTSNFGANPCFLSSLHNTFNHQRHLVSRSTLRIFRAEATARWLDAAAA